MGIVPAEYNKADSPGGGKYLKGSDFEGGVVVEVIGFEKVRSNKPEFGATETDSLVKNNILGVGEVFRYTFKQVLMSDFGEMDSEKVFDSKSAVFFNSFRKVNPDKGTKLSIKRSGTGKQTRYEIIKV